MEKRQTETFLVDKLTVTKTTKKSQSRESVSRWKRNYEKEKEILFSCFFLFVSGKEKEYRLRESRNTDLENREISEERSGVGVGTSLPKRHHCGRHRASYC